MWKLLPLLNSKLCKFSDSKSIHFTNIPSPWKLGAETQNQEEAGKRDESVKVYIKCIFWFKILTAIFRSVAWNEIRIGDKKTGLRRILSRFIDWILWHQLILIVLSQESYHQDQAQCQGGSGHRKSPRRASAKSQDHPPDPRAHPSRQDSGKRQSRWRLFIMTLLLWF